MKYVLVIKLRFILSLCVLRVMCNHKLNIYFIMSQICDIKFLFPND